MSGRIYIGIGGWTYEDWRGPFYPEGLTQKRELEYASRQMTAIEVNGTYYGSMKPASYIKWYEETPDDFVFTLKGSRYTTNRRVLAEAGDSIEKFISSGITELKQKLGPINWQFMATKKFDPEDFEAFLKLLPKRHDGLDLRHAVEVRHDSFRDDVFVQMAREYGVAIITAGDSEFPQIADVTAPFVYLRLMGTREYEAEGYTTGELDAWAGRLKTYADGGVPQDMEAVTRTVSEKPTDVFAFVISGHKVRNPAAAMGLIKRLRL
ncbi:DUF72 domain-containing protein [Asticcacaulis machinosus]|uniref:DUF72 domain-containing protein n=1 Tax=Asticcacaulis machinosus TaxID=2984211 RepID=A0ABT5HLW3_9CAUL|nr:DUF72 domain-containing protein [Asticcacaulis machinosus]MDC7676584.1 DUF72 domain-containing protein [Asticcacaulis machinosus]